MDSFSYQTYRDSSGRAFRGTGSGDGHAIIDIDTGERHELRDYTASLNRKPQQQTIVVASSSSVHLGTPEPSPIFGIIGLVFLFGPAFLVTWLIARLLGGDIKDGGRLLVLLVMAMVAVQIVGYLIWDWSGPWHLAVWYYKEIVLNFWGILYGFGKWLVDWLRSL